MRAPEQRRAMVRDQIMRRGVRSRGVLKAMLSVERAAFVPGGPGSHAHVDSPISIGEGQTISQPYMAAVMLELLMVRRGMRVLEVGAGSGYVLALLSRMGATPFGIEWFPGLAARIPANFSAAGMRAPEVKAGDGGLGWPERAPFDRVLVSAACPSVPQPLLDQLSPGGVLVAPTGSLSSQVVERVTKSGGVRREYFDACVFVPLRGTHGFAK